MTAPDFAGAAFRAAMRGWRVYRLSPGSRVPLKGSHGYLDATRELDVVRLWWLDTPTANIGCAMGAATGAWILDVDRQHGGPLALAELTVKHGALPKTLITRTPSGGFHHFFRWDDGIPEIRNSVSRVGNGLDVIGAGGGVPLPPSVRSSSVKMWNRMSISRIAVLNASSANALEISYTTAGKPWSVGSRVL